MKKIYIYFLACAYAFSSSQAFAFSLSDFGNPFTEIPRFAKWKNEMEAQINATFQLIVPEKEQRLWVMQEDKISLGDIDETATGNWIPRGDKQYTRPECLEIHFENIPNIYAKGKDREQYRTASQCFESFKKAAEASPDYKFVFNVIENNEQGVVVELDRYENGVSGLIKKDTQLKHLERWFVSGDWLVILKYEVRPKVDPEKLKEWDQLKKTWIERFSKVHFG